MTYQLRCAVCGHAGPAPHPVVRAAESAAAKSTLSPLLARVRCTRCGTRGNAQLAALRASEQTSVKERLVGAGLDVVSDPVYHRPDCKWVARMNVNEIVEFGSRVEAEFRGDRACKVCKP